MMHFPLPLENGRTEIGFILQMYHTMLNPKVFLTKKHIIGLHQFIWLTELFPCYQKFYPTEPVL